MEMPNMNEYVKRNKEERIKELKELNDGIKHYERCIILYNESIIVKKKLIKYIENEK